MLLLRKTCASAHSHTPETVDLLGTELSHHVQVKVETKPWKIQASRPAKALQYKRMCTGCHLEVSSGKPTFTFDRNAQQAGQGVKALARISQHLMTVTILQHH